MIVSSLRRLLLAAAATVPALSAAHAQALPLPERAVFVVLLNRDTIAAETMTRTAGQAEGALRMLSPMLLIKQAITFTPENGIERVTLSVGRGAKGDSAVQQSELILRGDSAVSHVEQTSGAPTTERRFAVPAGAVPFINLSGLSLEQIIRRARVLGRDTLNVPVLLTNAQTIYASVVRAGADSVVIVLGGVVLRARTDTVGRLLGASVPAQNVIFQRLPGDSPAGAWSPARVSYAPPAGAPYAAQEVTVRTPAGLTLAGTLTIPAHTPGARLPAVVMITGSGAQDRDEALPGLSAEYRPFRDIADTLSRRGIAVLRLDDRGVGASSAGPASATTADFADDVRAALAWLRARPEIDPARLGLVGHSEGGIIAPMVAATDPRLRGIVLIAGTASRGLDIVHEQLRYLITQDTSLSAARRDSLFRVALAEADSSYKTPGWKSFFATYDPRVTARRVRTPTLILQGETDRQVPLSEAGALARALREGGNRNVTVRTFPRLDHLMVEDASGNPMGYQSLSSFRVRNDLRGALADWLARTL
jgi:alpha-beta hydrolase superfamily lysophospholipase